MILIELYKYNKKRKKNNPVSRTSVINGGDSGGGLNESNTETTSNRNSNLSKRSSNALDDTGNLDIDKSIPNEPVPLNITSNLQPASITAQSSSNSNDLNEQSSLVDNKVTNSSNPNLSIRQQLPKLEFSGQVTPLTKKQQNNTNINDNVSGNITLSSTSLSTRNINENAAPPKNLNEITASAHEFYSTTNGGGSQSTRVASPVANPSQRPPVYLNSRLNNSNNNLYTAVKPSTNSSSQSSASNVESRLNDAAAPQANLSYLAKTNRNNINNSNNNLSTINNNSASSPSSSSLAPIGTVIGGIKVLPTPKPIYLNNNTNSVDKNNNVN